MHNQTVSLIHNQTESLIVQPLPNAWTPLTAHLKVSCKHLQSTEGEASGAIGW